MSEQFSRDTMLARIEEELDNGCQTLDDIQTESTNIDPWVIGTYQAAESLGKFDTNDMLYTSTNLTGVFGAIEYVTYYETDQLEEVNTDLTDPEKLASMVAYINMDITLSDLLSDFDLGYDDELTGEQVDKIKDYITQQVN